MNAGLSDKTEEGPANGPSDLDPRAWEIKFECKGFEV